MRIYIVRHGQSASNALRNNQGKESKLTLLGTRQAKKIARRAKRLPIDLVVSSDFARSLQTAEIIRRLVRRKYIVTPLLREEKHPSEIEGQNANSPKVIKFKKLMHKNRNRKNWHFSDEENFFDLKERMKKFINFLRHRKEKNILVVGHVMATRMLVGLMTLGDAFTPNVFHKMRDNWMLKNTGVIVCHSTRGRWKLVTWNDHAHLG